ncbi:hypothetical protein KSX_06490 [Ktedonospora formicarum]|uniref:Uncharacterized protein n=1 Tax=Ktedonospora formicarum TaxID=2778364 RepID=A0A8J3HSK0_9CHLR|nr:hypothetical protein KSX_06490 [Ktedonospora formicarum]
MAGDGAVLLAENVEDCAGILFFVGGAGGVGAKTVFETGALDGVIAVLDVFDGWE